MLELNTSQVQLTEAELTYNQSIYDYLVAKADLDQVLGKDYIAAVSYTHLDVYKRQQYPQSGDSP